LSDFGDQKICWITVHNRHEDYVQIDWVKEVIAAMAEAKLHEKYDMAFPALGYYDGDGVATDYVLELVHNAFSEGGKGVDYHLGY